MNTCKLQIITPNKILYQGNITMIEYNTVEGQVGVFPGHVAMTQVIAPGKLSIYEENSEQPKIGALISGFVQIMPDVITIMAEIVEWKEDIDKDRALRSKERAEKRISEHNENIDLARAELSLKRALVRLDVAS